MDEDENKANVLKVSKTLGEDSKMFDIFFLHDNYVLLFPDLSNKVPMKYIVCGCNLMKCEKFTVVLGLLGTLEGVDGSLLLM